MKERQRFRDGEEPLVGKADFHDAGLRERCHVLIERWTSNGGGARRACAAELERELVAAASASAPAAACKLCRIEHDEDVDCNEAKAALASLESGVCPCHPAQCRDELLWRAEIAKATAERPAGTPRKEWLDEAWQSRINAVVDAVQEGEPIPTFASLATQPPAPKVDALRERFAVALADAESVFKDALLG